MKSRRSRTAFVAIALVACGTSAETARCPEETSSLAELQSPTTRFATDVFPIFGQSCNFRACHGTDTNGVALGASDPAVVHAAIVGVPSRPIPSMPYVMPGSPDESFLLRKLDGSQCALTARCENASCGDTMPRGDERLPKATRDTVRRWIAQGAKND